MRSELACSTSGIIATGTETKYKQSLLRKQNTNKVCCGNKIQTKFVANIKYRNFSFQKQNTNKVCCKKIQAKFVENTKYRNSGCKTRLGGASNDVHRKMRWYLGEAASPPLFKMSQVLKNKFGGGDDYNNLWMPCWKLLIPVLNVKVLKKMLVELMFFGKL